MGKRRLVGAHPKSKATAVRIKYSRAKALSASVYPDNESSCIHGFLAFPSITAQPLGAPQFDLFTSPDFSYTYMKKPFALV